MASKSPASVPFSVLSPCDRPPRVGFRGLGWAWLVGLVLTSSPACGSSSDVRNQAEPSATQPAANNLQAQPETAIEGLRVSSGIQVDAESGSAWRLRVISGDANALEVDLRGGQARLSRRDHDTSGPLHVAVSVPDLRELSLSGASTLKLRGLSGPLKLEVPGASQLTLAGDIPRLEGRVSGASRVSGAQLAAETAELKASGASMIELKVRESLKLRASGASQVVLHGRPKQLDSDTSGMAQVRIVGAGESDSVAL